MGADRRLRPILQGLLESGQLCRPVKQRAAGHHYFSAQTVQRPGDGVVLPAGDHHPVSGPHQRVNGDIQTVGGIQGKNNPFRVGHAKQLCRRAAAGKGSIRRPHGGLVPSPSGGGHMGHGIGRGPRNRGRLLHGSSRTIQIDQRSTSS